MVGGLIAANSSTILTHLNWGASYLVHDFYRRFMKKGATEQHYVVAGRVCHGAAVRRLFRDWSSCSIRRRTPSTSSCRSAPARGCSTWCAGSGGGSTAWCEIVAMVSLVRGLGRSSCILTRHGTAPGTRAAVDDRRSPSPRSAGWSRRTSGRRPISAVLIEFYRKVRPFGPGWEPIRAKAGVTAAEAGGRDATTSRSRCSAGSRAAS